MMAEFKRQLFMGNGDESMARVAELFLMVSEAASILSEGQQIDSGRGYQEFGKNAVENRLEEIDWRLKSIADQLYVAITGRKVVKTKEVK